MSKSLVSIVNRPMNVVVAKGSRAEKHFRGKAGLPGGLSAHPEAIAPGIAPTPKQDLIFYGGKTIAQLVFTNFYVGGSSAWTPSDIQSIDKSLSSAMSDKNLNNVMSQYFKGAAITSTFMPSQVLSGSKPATFSQGDVETLVAKMFAGGLFTGYDLGSTVFNFMLPSGCVLNTDTTTSNSVATPVAHAAAKGNPAHPEDEDNSLQGLGGYHGSVHVTATDTVYYAVGVYSEVQPGGVENGIVAFDLPWKNVVATFYHELNEARTDPDVEDAIKAGNDPKAVKYLGWMSREGDECGDFPISEVGPDLALVMKEVPLASGSGTVPIQFQYSNAVHGPEGPIAKAHKVLAHT